MQAEPFQNITGEKLWWYCLETDKQWYFGKWIGAPVLAVGMGAVLSSCTGTRYVWWSLEKYTSCVPMNRCGVAVIHMCIARSAMAHVFFTLCDWCSYSSRVLWGTITEKRTGRDACAERCSVSCALPVGHHDFEILHWKFVLTIASHREQDQGDSGQLLGRLWH